MRSTEPKTSKNPVWGITSKQSRNNIRQGKTHIIEILELSDISLKMLGVILGGKT